MSRGLFPTRKGTEIFPYETKQPVQIRFSGIEPGSAEAKALFESHQGTIDHFYARCATAYEISIVDFMTQEFQNDDIELIYYNRSGVEMIYVKPRQIEHEPEEPEKEEPVPKPLDPWTHALVRFTFNDVDTARDGKDYVVLTVGAVTDPVRSVDGENVHGAIIRPGQAEGTTMGKGVKFRSLEVEPDEDGAPRYAVVAEVDFVRIGPGKIKLNIHALAETNAEVEEGAEPGSALTVREGRVWEEPNLRPRRKRYMSERKSWRKDVEENLYPVLQSIPEGDGLPVDPIDRRISTMFEVFRYDETGWRHTNADGVDVAEHPNVYLGKFSQPYAETDEKNDDGSWKYRERLGGRWSEIAQGPEQKPIFNSLTVTTPPPSYSPGETDFVDVAVEGFDIRDYYEPLKVEGDIASRFFKYPPPKDYEKFEEYEDNDERELKVRFKTDEDTITDSLPDGFGMPLLGVLEIDTIGGSLEWTPTA